jgi:two-component system cell cycle response regulator
MIVLVAEDSTFYRQVITGHLRDWGFDFQCAKDGKQAWEALVSDNAPRLALLDWVLPEIDGVEVCRRVRARAEGQPYTYTILLTSKSQKQEMLEAMEAGADDFVSKPFDPLELQARLLVGKRIIELQQKLFSANSALHFAANHDFLTRVSNRAAILAFLQRELARSRRDGAPLGVMLVDVDNFKNVNDQLGHEAGDCVLQELAKRFCDNLREYDGVGRYGGEEFLLVLPNCDLRTTLRRADEIRNLIAQTPVSTSAGDMTITISAGATVAGHTESVEALLRSIDAALYQAKRNGRNRVEEAVTISLSAATGKS